VTEIAATAVVDKDAELGEDVVVGPGCVIDSGAVIGDGCVLDANVVVAGGTRIGRGNRIFANCVLGREPQILGSPEPETELIIGDENTIREMVTINRGSPKGDGKTVIGDRNFLSIGAHLGHDCHVEDDTMIGNYCQIGGHCKIEHHAWICAISGTHHFVTIGRFTYVAGFAGMSADQPPFVRVSGSYPCTVRGLNVVGLKRAGFLPASIEALEHAYRLLYRRRGPRSLANAVEELAAEGELDENVRYLIDSIRRTLQHRMGRYRELVRGD